MKLNDFNRISTLRIASLFLFALMLLTGTTLQAQSISSAKDTLGQATVDLAVPDAPAFKILDVEPSDIMRPSTARDIGIALGNFITNGSVLPRSLAVEVSPGLLFGESLSKYKKNPFLYRMRVSLATRSLSSSETDIGIGIRFTVTDKSDLRMDEALQESLKVIGLKVARYLRDCTGSAILQPGQPGYEEEIRECANKLAWEDLEQQIETTRELVKQRLWNARIMEFGFGVRAVSPDSLAKNLSASKYASWLSLAEPLGASGQLFAGAKFSTERDSTKKLGKERASVALRGYYGKNEHKLSSEMSWEGAANQVPRYKVILGSETNLRNGFWLDFSLGFEKLGSGGTSTVSSIKLRLATPEPN